MEEEHELEPELLDRRIRSDVGEEDTERLRNDLQAVLGVCDGSVILVGICL